MDSEYFYEKEAEYFGFTPFQFLDNIGEIVVKEVFSMFERVGEIKLGKGAPFLSKGQIEAGVGQWSALVEGKFGRNYELFESYVIKNVLVLPDEFVLPHHRNIICSKDNGSIAKDQDAEIAELLVKISAVILLVFEQTYCIRQVKKMLI
jgi:hypothetical protein